MPKISKKVQILNENISVNTGPILIILGLLEREFNCLHFCRQIRGKASASPGCAQREVEITPIRSDPFNRNVTKLRSQTLNNLQKVLDQYLLWFKRINDNKVFGVGGGNSVREKCSVNQGQNRIDFGWPISYMKFHYDMS